MGSPAEWEIEQLKMPNLCNSEDNRLEKKSQSLKDVWNYDKDLILVSPESHNERRKRVNLKKCLKKYWLKMS